VLRNYDEYRRIYTGWSAQAAANVQTGTVTAAHGVLPAP
jgi:hypothetical protein